MLSNTLIKWLSRDVPDKSTGLPARKNIALFTDIGLKRLQNQDRVACLKVSGNEKNDGGFLAIAISDGMGGMKDGAECATRALASFFNSLIKYRHRPEMERLRQSTIDSNDYVYEFSDGAGGATLSALLITEKHGTFSVNVGDSRIYAETIEQPKQLRRLTTDDSLAEAVGGHGRELLQFIGMGPGIRPHINFINDVYSRFLLTTDGIHFPEENVFSSVFVNSVDVYQAAQRLGTLARWLGAPDNASGAVVSLQDAKELITKDDFSIQFFDPFSELHITWIKDELKHSSPNELRAIEKTKPQEPSTTPELSAKDDNQPEIESLSNDNDQGLSPSKTKKSKAKKKLKSLKTEAPKDEDLQIVIEMDIEHKDSADDSSQ